MEEKWAPSESILFRSTEFHAIGSREERVRGEPGNGHYSFIGLFRRNCGQRLTLFDPWKSFDFDTKLIFLNPRPD